MSDNDQSHWDSDRLNRKSVAEKLTSVLNSEEGPLVVSVEAGFGAGKSFFAERWAKDLSNQGDIVIQFNAWETDHADDPLIAFSAALLSLAPGLSKPAEREAVSKTAKTVMLAVVGGVAKSAGQKFLGERLDEIVSGIKDIADQVLAKDEEATADDGFAASDDEAESAEASKDLAEIGKAGTDALAAAASSQFTQYLAREQLRKKTLPQQLKELRSALGSDKNPDPRIIVFVDELDRCRPDYAISLLEDIKHLFQVEGYIFVLMINEKRLSSTAARLFGEGDENEPYLKKFIDWRFKLPAASLLSFCEDRFSGLPKHRRILKDENDVLAITDFVSNVGITPRQLESAFKQVFFAIKLLGENPKIDSDLLVVLAVMVEFSIDLKKIDQHDNNRSTRDSRILNSIPLTYKVFAASQGDNSIILRLNMGEDLFSVRGGELQSKYPEDEFIFESLENVLSNIGHDIMDKEGVVEAIGSYYLRHVEVIQVVSPIYGF